MINNFGSGWGPRPLCKTRWLTNRELYRSNLVVRIELNELSSILVVVAKEESPFAETFLSPRKTKSGRFLSQNLKHLSAKRIFRISNSIRIFLLLHLLYRCFCRASRLFPGRRRRSRGTLGKQRAAQRRPVDIRGRGRR